MSSAAMQISRNRLIHACREICPRCALGHFPVFEGLIFTHGIDESSEGSGTFIPPEPCTADPVWRVIKESEGEVIHCEHGIADYEYCEVCSKEYKRAAREHGYQE